MPTPGNVKWTLKDAHAYRDTRVQIFGKGGLAEDTMLSLRKDPSRLSGWGAPQGFDTFETTLQKYQTRAGKTDDKLAQTANGAQRVNKKGVAETRDQLVQRKIQKDIGRASEVNSELIDLGRYIECISHGSVFIPGPIKKFDSAWRKTRGDNHDKWTDSKDLARCTIAHEQPWGVAQIAGTVINICQPIYGMKLIKQQETKPEPTDANPCGYSGWNFVVVFKGSKLPAEIQVNTYDMMYGKMSKKEYTDALLGSRGNEYASKELEMKFPGGLGHLFYEIARDNRTTSAERKAAAEIGVWYNKICRNLQNERAAGAPECLKKYRDFCDSLQSEFARKDVIATHPLPSPWAEQFELLGRKV